MLEGIANMTKEQKTLLAKMVEAIDELDTGLGVVHGDLDGLRDELQEDFEELSEKQQEGDKGEKLKDQIGPLEVILDQLQECESNFAQVMDVLKELING